MIAKILVDIKSKNVDKTYDYIIPSKYEDILEIGARVIVPFGKRNVMGFCLEIAKTSSYKKELKSINKIIDMEPYLTRELIDLAKKMQEESCSLLIQILETMLPAALKMIYKPKVKVINKMALDSKLLPFFEDSDELLLELIDSEYYSLVKNEMKKQTLKQIYDIRPKNRSLAFKYVSLVKEPTKKLTEKQNLVYKYLKNKKDNKSSIKNIINKFGISTSIINTLEKYGIVRTFYQETYRKVISVYPSKKQTIHLNDEQKIVYEKIINSIGKRKTFLLHGVTGSGKTEIYIKAIKKALEEKKTIIFLVPEISLTPMMMSRLMAEFKNKVAVLHSGLSTLEKYDEWRRIIRKEASIVVGARSACFAPLDNIGLIIVDECHESTYKQENMPNYYAVDVLKKRAEYYNSVIVLGSATPNIESYARHVRGYYELLTINKRALNSELPEVEVVNMKKEFIKGNHSNFSKVLQEEIQKRLDLKEQVILLINRRGYSNFVICRNCGHVIMCPNCDVSLTYHEYSHSLKCHYCNYEIPVPKVCPKCKTDALRFMGSGTQKIEKELIELFSNAKIIRMDNDTTRRKNSHEKLLHEFEESGDILLGTQMIAKGLDFPKVTLVGIIQADNNLFVSDFRAPEKTFQLIMQVSGRSGRRSAKGKVIIQAFNPNHYAIKYACEHDYLGFYHYEMNIRRLAKYAPFYYMIYLKISGEFMRDVFYHGIEVVKYLKRNLEKDVIILGPAVPAVKKINNRYNCEITIKYKNIDNINKILNQMMEKYQTDDKYIMIDRFPNVG